MTEAINVEVLRAELMKFSKEELVTELLGALLELAGAENGGPDRRIPLVSRPNEGDAT